MKIIGITGGVGSGKSLILDYFQQKYGAKVIIADQVSHKLMEPGTRGYYEIVEFFGSGILNNDMTINREKLGKIVFGDKGKLDRLNGIMHPLVKEFIAEEIRSERASGKDRMVIIEAALLIEEHYEVLCDELWYIYSDEETRRARLKASRGYSEEKISNIFLNQCSEEMFRQHCQVVIDNSGTVEETYRQIDEKCRR
ncbi:dephospho-CoA kinase [Anaerobium acetethylicum]|uniref:Dephospho-CoA kinase n=1 Tax=Anaerobium acetethylicum TaxID=1619234 RepID=A0A1D3TPR3_9FIRM|nr:dephospho-CoA kinase [Anaerobium acetethylicum]SCP95469.1 dephospho-CoA kinase [Anaerobium acetethylicum]